MRVGDFLVIYNSKRMPHDLFPEVVLQTGSDYNSKTDSQNVDDNYRDFEVDEDENSQKYQSPIQP